MNRLGHLWHGWRALTVVAALAVLVALPLGALIVSAQGPAAPAPAPLPSGPLPESYPWITLAEEVSPAVVNVRTTGEAARVEVPPIPEPFRRFFPPEFRERMPEPPHVRRGLGTGFIITSDGSVVTNHHVVHGAKSIEVTLQDGRKFPAKLVGSDSATDLALVKMEASGLPTLRLGESSALRVGEPVMAIGNPFGLDHTVTVGIISGKSRVIGAGPYDDFLQTDAAINPGNSGGPLINTRGQVVGIATAIASRSGGFQGIGFAIPIDLAKPVIEQLRTAGRVTRGWLGVVIQSLTPELAKSFGLTSLNGALVSSVLDGSPAASAGLKPGDVIVRYDDKVVDDPRDLSRLVAETVVGRTVEVRMIRDGKVQTARVSVGNRAQASVADQPAEPRAEKRLGLQLQELTPQLARRLGVKEGKGVVVADVQPDSPAAKAGITQGDVIREINRAAIEGIEDVERALGDDAAREAILMRVERGGAARYVVIEVG